MPKGHRPEVERALRFIADNLRRPLSVAEVARAAHLSEFHLHRVFHAAVGESVGRFVTRQRLERAALSLAYELDQSITDVALSSGYSSSSNFSKGCGFVCARAARNSRPGEVFGRAGAARAAPAIDAAGMGTLSKPRRILITGASRGIGRECARLLARAGHTVVLAARDAAALSALAREIEGEGGCAQVLPLDLSDAESIAGAARATLEAGPCDVLVNNAGLCDQAEFLLQSPAAQRAELELNYWGAVTLSRALLPSFIRNRAGLIVNVSSLLGSVASPTMTNYCASKAALEAWSHALHAEVARFGVRVSVFVAPHTDTEAGRRARFDGVYSLPVTYTARELVRAIDSAPRKYVASPVYRLLLWLARLFPAFMERRVGASAIRLLARDPLAALAAGEEPAR